MRLSRLIRRPIPSDASNFSPAEMLQVLLDRDAEIRNVINSNDANSASKTQDWLDGGAGRPGFAAVRSDGTTPVVVLEGPAEGASRLVQLATIVNGYLGASQTVELYLDDGSVSDYHIVRETMSFSASFSYPPVDVNSPFIMEHGWTLWGVTSAAAAADDIYFTVSYSDDAPSGEATSDYHLAVLAADEVVYETLVDQPPEHKSRLVRLVTADNDDNTPHNYTFTMYDIGNAERHLLLAEATVAGGDIVALIGPNHIIVVPHGWRLEAIVTLAQNTNGSHVTAHYLEVDADDSGEGADEG